MARWLRHLCSLHQPPACAAVTIRAFKIQMARSLQHSYYSYLRGSEPAGKSVISGLITVDGSNGLMRGILSSGEHSGKNVRVKLLRRLAASARP